MIRSAGGYARLNVLYLLVVVGFFAALGLVLWRTADDPVNTGHARGHNAPPEAEVGYLSGLTGPALGTAESLVDDDGRPADL